jgi:hypothetical protein
MSESAVWNLLIEAGLWPTAGGGPEIPLPLPPGGDLLPAVCRAWSERVASADERRRNAASARADVLCQAQQGGARLTWGVPGFDLAKITAWLGHRLVWWPGGVPEGRCVGLVSSRLGQDLDRHKSWFAVLRTACMRLDPQQDLLVTAGTTAAQRFVQRCGQLFGLRALSIEIDREDALSWRGWGRRVLASIGGESTTACRALISPPVRHGDSPVALDELIELPAPDRAIFALSDRILALHVRPEGNLMRLLLARLRLPDSPPASVFLALGPDLVPRDPAGELLDAGGVGWLVMNAAGEPGHDNLTPWNSAPPERAAASIVSCPPTDGWPYLTHCTRRRSGPWPGENEDQFLDDLILDRAGADHSALAALWRIARSGRLIAGSEFVRGETPVVSLTAVPLDEIRNLRTYRSHLGRWDFEPYGICIRRDWLQRRGTRPVQYGDEALWDAMPSADRPFFQKRESHTASGKVFDWTVEQEWRHIGDLRLDGIPAHAAMLFVPSEAEARQLAASSPWPVVVVSDDC